MPRSGVQKAKRARRPRAFARFDPSSVWRRMTKDQRADVGRAAIDLLVAQATEVGTAGMSGERAAAIHRASGAAASRSRYLLAFALGKEIAAATFASLPIPLSVGRICRGCGCTEYDPCRGGCSWVTDCMCSACVGTKRKVRR